MAHTSTHIWNMLHSLGWHVPRHVSSLLNKVGRIEQDLFPASLPTDRAYHISNDFNIIEPSCV